MKIFNFKRRNLLTGPHILGSLFILAGICAIFSPLFIENESPLVRVLGIGIGALLLGLIIASTYDGTLIDFSKRRFKEYLSIAGYKLGNWDSLPEILNVSVVSTSYMNKNTPNGISPTFSGEVTDFRTIIFSNTSIPFFSFVYSSRDRAIHHAKILAKNLDAELIIDLPKRA